MIRRTVGNHSLLFTQDAHARLAGDLARHVGNAAFTALSEPAVLATTLHDAGWPLHDDAPTLNPDHLPLDVFEVSHPIGLKVWAASADRAQAADPYAGLLVSLHALSLSVYATTRTTQPHEKFDTASSIERFEVNKFQHKEIERQENLRRALGMRVDLPLTCGLAQPNLDPREDQLHFDFRLLQAMDQLSLAICCTHPPMPQSGPVHPHPGSPTTHFAFRRAANDTDVTVHPWPFNAPEIPVTLPTRRLPTGPWADEPTFRAAYAAAPEEQFPLRVTPR
jgi:hypothetical protein